MFLIARQHGQKSLVCSAWYGMLAISLNVKNNSHIAITVILYSRPYNVSDNGTSKRDTVKDWWLSRFHFETDIYNPSAFFHQQ